MRIKYQRNPHQAIFHDDLKSKQVLLTSGYGAGKSYALVMKTLMLSQINKPYDGGLFAPSMPEYKRDLLPIFKEILEVNKIKHFYHQTDKWFRFPWSRGRLHVFTCEKRIRGPNLAFASINEPGLITYERFKEVVGRVRVAKAQCLQINLAGTPEGKSNWLYEHFVEAQNPDRSIVFGNTQDNKYLHEEYIRNLEDNFDSVMLQAYLHGKFVNMTGNMFYYAFTRENNCDKSIKRQPGFVHIGMDFNVDNMTCSMWNIIGDQALAFDEIVLPNDSDTNKLCNAIKARGYDPSDCVIYPDPSGRSRKTTGYNDIHLLKLNGFQKVRAKPRAPTFRDRQLGINNLLEKGRIKINPDKCKALVKDLEAVEQSVADFSKVKDNPNLTHASDGMDYMLDIVFPLSGKKPITSTLRHF